MANSEEGDTFPLLPGGSIHLGVDAAVLQTLFGELDVTVIVHHNAKAKVKVPIRPSKQ